MWSVYTAKLNNIDLQYFATCWSGFKVSSLFPLGRAVWFTVIPLLHFFFLLNVQLITVLLLDWITCGLMLGMSRVCFNLIHGLLWAFCFSNVWKGLHGMAISTPMSYWCARSFFPKETKHCRRQDINSGRSREKQFTAVRCQLSSICKGEERFLQRTVCRSSLVTFLWQFLLQTCLHETVQMWECAWTFTLIRKSFSLTNHCPLYQVSADH